MQAVRERRHGTSESDRRRQKDFKNLKKVLDKMETMC